MKAVCIASGPSLTTEDVESVRLWRHGGDGRLVVVVNTTFRAAPWADALFAMDTKWWGVYHREVKRDFAGTAYTTSNVAMTYGIRRVKINHHRNSGAGAVALAEWLGASSVALLGYDCQHDGKTTHWHGSHPQGLGDALTVKRWPAKFAELARTVRVPVVNASRATALTCFNRGDLAAFLHP